MFAVIQISGKQYKVQKGDVINVSKIDGTEGETLTINSVLMVIDDKKTTVGTPFVKGATVQAKIVQMFKGEKVNVARYKHKVRYRKNNGFRPHLTKLEIVSVG